MGAFGVGESHWVRSGLNDLRSDQNTPGHCLGLSWQACEGLETC